MAERKEKATYYFKNSQDGEGLQFLIRRISYGRSAISYQNIGEFTSQERDKLRLIRKKFHRKRVNEMDKNIAGPYSLMSILDRLKKF